MVVTVQGARPKNILDLIHETISALIKDSFQGVAYDFYIPCPDCLEKKVCMKKYKNIVYLNWIKNLSSFCNTNVFFSFYVFMIYLPECVATTKNYEIIHADAGYCAL
jgi:hypothetical protein